MKIFAVTGGRSDYDLLGPVLEAIEERPGMDLVVFAACARGVMCPIGTGVLDYPAIRRALIDIGYAGTITIEQERDPRNAGTSLRDVAASRAFLASAGFA